MPSSTPPPAVSHATSSHPYQPSQVEPKWQARWEEAGVFETPTSLDILQQKPKYYILDMFPYPSGAGLHVGHPEGYTATDVIARMKRMQGFHVLHPMGWDSFGLPAERAAMRSQVHPAAITAQNIQNFRKQIKRLGFSYDWTREITTSDPSYYRWTQWIFLKLYERGLAYLAEIPVNWCPALGTVLANEEVKEGKYVETGDPVEKRLMRQWMLKITAYAERLLADLDTLDWPDSVKNMQRHWIGKSEGAEIIFTTPQGLSFPIYTSRPETLFGVTYCVLAPEHPLVPALTTPDQANAVHQYIRLVKNKSDLARTDLSKEKTGVFTGSFALHPVTQEKIPLWIADYVLLSYGTGAIMAVPAHDERDFDFAQQHQLPIRRVIHNAQTKPDLPITHVDLAEQGNLVQSHFLDGLAVDNAKKKITEWLTQHQKGSVKIQYRLRDWLFSRQRYWGEPIPLLHKTDGTLLPLNPTDLPLTLPLIDKYQPTEDGSPPLARAQDWLSVTLPDQSHATRETNTMPQWAGSCWYYLRYLDANNHTAPWDKALERYWMPVDLYVGGVEHAVLHLLYARFWHKVLYDCGLVSTIEPFQKLFNQGMILAYSYRDTEGKYYHPSEVEEATVAPHTENAERSWQVKLSKKPVTTQIEKMSKSKLNVVNPDEVVDQYGADAMRLYELFMGPLEAVKPWQMTGVEGVYRFLHRVWRLVIDEKTGGLHPRITQAPPESAPNLWKELHQTIKKVTSDTESLQFNTAISQMMIFVNEAMQHPSLPQSIVMPFLQLLNPYAPHLCEELWEKLGQSTWLAKSAWPKFEESLCQDTHVTMAVTINGKKREEILVSIHASETEIQQQVLNNEKIKKWLEGKTPKKIIVVKHRIINLVL